MQTLKKLFGETKITWKFLIIFSITIGILVGVLNRIPSLKNTSFQDIAIVFDMWIILAIFVIVNCKSCKEAVEKCFTFFLISQPVIYFTEIVINVIVNNANFKDIFIQYFRNYYIGAGWLCWTFLTIPGAFIAYQVKRNNWLSGLILSVATLYLSTVGTSGLLKSIFSNFPYHLLNSLICLIVSFALINILLNNKKAKTLCLIITIIGVVAGATLFYISFKAPLQSYKIIDFDENLTMVNCKVEDENIARVSLEAEDNFMTVYSNKKTGETKIIVTDSNKNQYIYIVNATTKAFNVELKK